MTLNTDNAFPGSLIGIETIDARTCRMTKNFALVLCKEKHNITVSSIVSHCEQSFEIITLLNDDGMLSTTIATDVSYYIIQTVSEK